MTHPSAEQHHTGSISSNLITFQKTNKDEAKKERMSEDVIRNSESIIKS